MNRTQARDILQRCNAPLDVQFHALGSAIVDALIVEANAVKYRRPKNANGSRARYFHAYVLRAANRAS